MAQNIKYQPYKYQESYIPMELPSMVGQALASQQQRYDATEGQLANMYRDLYDRQIYDPQAFNEEMEAIKSKVEDIDKQYKGDLSAGMNDYIRLIGKAKQSPFWKTNELLNKEVERQHSISEQLKAQGKNVLSFSTLPKSATTIDAETGQKRYLRPDEIKFDIQSQLDYTEQQGKLWDKALHEERRSGALPNVLNTTKPWLHILNKSGITDPQVQNKLGYIYEQYKDTDEYQQQKRKLIELEGLSSDKAEEHILNDVINTGQSREYLNIDTQTIHNPDYDRNTGKPTGQLPFSGTYQIDPSQSVEEVKSNINSIRGALSNKSGLSKKQLEEQKRTGKLSPFPTTVSMPEVVSKSEESKNITKLELLKKDYSMLWEASGKDNDKFLTAIEQLETDRAKSKYLLMYHPDLEAQNIFTKTIEEKVNTGLNSDFTKLDDNLNTDKTKKGSDITDAKKKITTTRTDLYHGRILVYNTAGEIYEMNPNKLGEDTEHYLNIAKVVLNNHYDYNDKAFKPVVDDREMYNLKGNIVYKAYVKGTDGYIHNIFVTKNGEPYTSQGKPIEDPNEPYEDEETFRYKMMNKVYSSENPFLEKAVGKKP